MSTGAEADIRSWGRAHRFAHRAARPNGRRELVRAVAGLSPAGPPALAYGRGRSYGDSCLNRDGVLLTTDWVDRWIAFDRDAGVLRCEAGATLADVIEVAGPAGWFLPVTPGTQFATLAGAVANDVHGKNHHRAGAFGAHVRRFELARSDGSVTECAPDENADLFAATIGGLGLTGAITWVELQLKPVESLALDVEHRRFDSLDRFFELSAAAEPDWEYVVAWVDLSARAAGGGDVRGVLSRANHAPADAADRRRRPRLRVTAPPAFPPGLVNRIAVRAFNALYYAASPADGVRRRTPFEPFFYPLDAVRSWNRVYGPGGFYQHQSVLPPDAARGGVAALCRRIAADGAGSPLTVLKRFGPKTSPGLLSFPMEGTTLAVDIPNRGRKTLRLLNDLDRIAIEHGGRLYPAKDGRMSAETFQAAFPNWRELGALADPCFSSSFWRRVTQGER